MPVGQYLLHDLQLSLLALIGYLELLHALLHLLVTSLLPLSQFPAPQPGLTVRRWKPQPQQLNAHLDSCKETYRWADGSTVKIL